MKWLLALSLLLVSMAAQAASPEERYLAARDAAIAKFSSPDAPDLEQHEAALAELAAMLRPIIEPVSIKGLPAEAKSNLTTLSSGDSGFGQLDGLVLASPDDKLRVVVTTTALVQHWVREHRKDGVPQELGAALRSGELYWWALTDAAFGKYAELPIVKPAAARLAVAVLGLRSNSDLKGKPNEIDVATVDGERVLILTAQVTTEIPPILRCEQGWNAAMKKPVDKSDPNGFSRREDAAEAVFIGCFIKQAPSRKFFPGVTKEAQALIDLLPAR
jgi:hypothetical protein